MERRRKTKKVERDVSRRKTNFKEKKGVVESKDNLLEKNLETSERVINGKS